MKKINLECSEDPSCVNNCVVGPGQSAAMNAKQSRANNSELQVTSESQHSIFQFCDVTSIGPDLQKFISEQHNLAFVEDELVATAITERAVSRRLEMNIYKQTSRSTIAKIHQIIGDGNSLFRALSLGITGTQNQHDLLRAYIVNHMLHSDVRRDLELLFLSRNQNRDYNTHLVEMQNAAEWGTEQEIIAAASLFDLSILCYSRYGNKGCTIQHFPPHFASEPFCTSACKHSSLYLVNSTGQHYNLATVQFKHVTEE